MILIAEDNPGKLARLENALTSEFLSAVGWVEYCGLRDRLTGEGRLTAACLDVGDFDGQGPDQMRDEAAALHKWGARVVMWSQMAKSANTPVGVVCARSESPVVVAAVTDYLQTGMLPTPLPPEVAWGTWEPAPALADLVALDFLCQGYLAIAGANPASGLTNEVVDTLQSAGELGAECLAEAARPEHQSEIANPRVWFAPAREAIERGGRKPSELWAALTDDADAVKPIRQFYEALVSTATHTAAEWHQLVIGAVAGFRRIADRREL